jgi:RNA polymerase sigma-70 factor (ECF subfamily)
MRTPRLALFSSLFVASDEQAMWRVQTGDDERAFAQLVRRWQVPIRRLCARMLGDPHRGEDLAQEAFVRVFARRKDWQPTGKFSTWLWRIALNLCYDELRRLKRRGEKSLDDADAPGLDDFTNWVAPMPGPDEALVAREEGERVRQAMQRLPDVYRSVVILRHYEGLKFREIAGVLDLPEGTVKSRMAEALTQLSRWLKPELAGPAKSPPPAKHQNRECPVL